MVCPNVPVIILKRIATVYSSRLKLILRQSHLSPGFMTPGLGCMSSGRAISLPHGQALRPCAYCVSEIPTLNQYTFSFKPHLIHRHSLHFSHHPQPHANAHVIYAHLHLRSGHSFPTLPPQFEPSRPPDPPGPVRPPPVRCIIGGVDAPGAHGGGAKPRGGGACTPMRGRQPPTEGRSAEALPTYWPWQCQGAEKPTENWFSHCSRQRWLLQ